MNRVEAKEFAERAFGEGRADDPVAGRDGRLLDPVPIVSPAGLPAGWFVPVALEGRLRGFVQIDGTGRFHRYASFASSADPENVADWTEPSRILSHARRLAGPDATLGTPVLSWDGSPDRLAWRVPLIGPAGERRSIRVAGQAAWLEGDAT